MANIGFNDLSRAQAIAIGDGLMAKQEYRLALHAYKAALRAETGGTSALQTRLGLAANPVKNTQQMFEILLLLEKINPHTFVGTGLATWHKPPPFFKDAKFLHIAAAHADLLGQPNWHWNLSTVLWALEEARSVEGDFVELGVFKGHTTLFAAEYLDFATWDKRWWLCDTFDGIPEDQQDPGWKEINKKIYQGVVSYEEVAARFAPFPNIHVHKGRVPEALEDGCPERIAFLHMDLNNAIAEIAALDRLYDRLSPGALIVFDDFGWQAASKQNRAETDWFAARGLRILALPTGQGLFRKP